MTAPTPIFLTLDEVLALHKDRIERYGGTPGLRDLAALTQALAAASATFGVAYLHGSLPEMAAAYLFHIVTARPFADGNKRTALLLAIVFLGLNDLRLADADGVAELVSGVAAGRVSKAEVAVYFQRRVLPVIPRH